LCYWWSDIEGGNNTARTKEKKKLEEKHAMKSEYDILRNDAVCIEDFCNEIAVSFSSILKNQHPPKLW
jgi:hypothetical protein